MKTEDKVVSIKGQNEKKLIRAADLAAFEAEHRERAQTLRVLAYVADEREKEVEELRAELAALSKVNLVLSTAVAVGGASAFSIGMAALLSSLEAGGPPASVLPPALALAVLVFGMASFGKRKVNMAIRKGKDRNGNDIPDPGPQGPSDRTAYDKEIGKAPAAAPAADKKPAAPAPAAAPAAEDKGAGK